MGKKQKILVTGGTGYIGSHTAVLLIEQGYDVVIIDNLANSDKKVIDKIEKITGVKPTFVKGDIGNKRTLEKLFTDHKFDAVIHFAALKAVGESVAHPIMYYRNNITGTINLLDVMHKHGVNKIVFSSSATVYGKPESNPINEDFPLSTTNPYGATKLMTENILIDVANSNKDFCAIILRYFNPIGAHPSGLIGESPQGVPNNIAPFILQVAGGKRSHLSIFGSDYDTVDGTGVRDYIHVMDLGDGHIAALDKINTAGVHIYNLGTGKGTSVLQLHKSFEKAVGKEIPYKFAERRAGDIDECYARADKAKRDLGWQTKYNIDDMCASGWNFYKKNNK